MKNPTSNQIECRFLLEKPGADKIVLDFLRSLGCTVEARRKIRQEDLYLDTFDWRMFRRGLALFFRRTGGKYFYTLKSLEKTSVVKTQPLEMTIEAKQNIREPADAVPVEIQKNVADIIYPRRLMPHLALRTERASYNIASMDGAEIEIAFDSTSFQVRGFHRPHGASRLFEIEMKLKKGSPSSFESVATAAAKTLDLSLPAKSRLETAIERLNIRFPAKNPPSTLVVKGDDRFDVAAQKILSFQLSRLNENIEGVAADIDTEFVHQARGATRRMRSMIRLFKGAIPERSAVYFAGELFWIASLLGAVRDIDVFVLNLPQFFAAIELAPEKGAEVLSRQLQEERRLLLEDLKAAFVSTRWRIFFLRLSTYCKRKPALTPSAALALETVDQIAPVIISRRLKEVVRRENLLRIKPKMKNYHKLRIEFKKLRYASEFFNSAFGGSLEPFIADVTSMQDCLGELQDTVFTKEMIQRLLKKWKGSVLDPMLIFTLGEIYQLQQKISLTKQCEFDEIWRKFDTENTREKLQKILGIVQADAK
jgi:CHAD domain-containing protein/uncharacterized protein YjbK